MMSTRKKKWFLVCASLLLFAQVSTAQTWSEWFSQKKTQKKYLLEQVAALKVYAGYLKKGYEIGSSGLDFIKIASKGEFDLHGAFFASLKVVSPEIKRSSKIVEIIQLQLQIGRAISSVESLELLGDANQAYVALVASNLLLDSLRDLEDLLLVITSGKLEMSDDERLERIDKLYSAMKEKKTFTLRFAAAARSLASAHSKELKTLKEMEDWYEIR
ncbi:hypothetical protein ACTJKC_15305 [Pedobacter sp. 22226]|uniref:hypothetical protein n=1 Tax=Pedobacter sp. 22226 TaxID=3453894 RepID=UPI003F825073